MAGAREDACRLHRALSETEGQRVLLEGAERAALAPAVWRAAVADAENAHAEQARARTEAERRGRRGAVVRIALLAQLVREWRAVVRMTELVDPLRAEGAAGGDADAGADAAAAGEEAAATCAAPCCAALRRTAPLRPGVREREALRQALCGVW